MGRKSKFTTEEKLSLVLICLEGRDSVSHTASINGIGRTPLRQWIANYQSLGVEGLNTTSKNSKHTKELKKLAVNDYLNEMGSLEDICKKYGLRSTWMLRQWIMKYNSHDELKSSGTGGVPIMTKGRKTTFEERIEIVKYCIEHQNNYAETAQYFKVSYQQVYSWVTKYENNGVESLQDNRGKRKSVDDMSEIDKLRAENKLLLAENRRKQMEIDFLKKLEEIERGR